MIYKTNTFFKEYRLIFHEGEPGPFEMNEPQGRSPESEGQSEKDSEYRRAGSEVERGKVEGESQRREQNVLKILSSLFDGKSGTINTLLTENESTYREYLRTSTYLKVAQLRNDAEEARTDHEKFRIVLQVLVASLIPETNLPPSSGPAGKLSGPQNPSDGNQIMPASTTSVGSRETAAQPEGQAGVRRGLDAEEKRERWLSLTSRLETKTVAELRAELKKEGDEESNKDLNVLRAIEADRQQHAFQLNELFVFSEIADKGSRNIQAFSHARFALDDHLVLVVNNIRKPDFDNGGGFALLDRAGDYQQAYRFSQRNGVITLTTGSATGQMRRTLSFVPTGDGSTYAVRGVIDNGLNTLNEEVAREREMREAITKERSRLRGIFAKHVDQSLEMERERERKRLKG